MITKNDFEVLSIETKSDIISARGTYLMSRHSLNFNISLYQLDGLYVEIWYSKITDEIARIEILKNSKTLDIYLERITLEDII